MKIDIPKEVAFIIEELMKHDYEAYAVGGCVRDSILGRIPDDWDITTSATPLQVKQLFRRTIDTGIRHGTVTVLIEKNAYEVTTYRIDGNYADSRHPESVEFTSNLLEDLKRRDFTINSMAYNDISGLVDEFGGIEDLNQGIIRCVGNAASRFEEDALRILRAVRFSAQLGFLVEEKTKAAIQELAPNLLNISKERIQAELTKLLVSPHPEYFNLLYDAGITKLIMPEFDEMMVMAQNNKYHCYSVGGHTLKMMENIPADKILRWTALLHDSGKIHTKITGEDGNDYFPDHAIASEQVARKILKELKMDNDTICQVTKLIYWHAYPFRGDKTGIRKVLSQLGTELFPKLLLVMEADTLAQSDYQKRLQLEQIDKIRGLYEEIIKDGDCICLKMLAVDGKDLMAAGIKQGQEVGKVLNRLLELVLEHPEYNTKEELLKRI